MRTGCCPLPLVLRDLNTPFHAAPRRRKSPRKYLASAAFCKSKHPTKRTTMRCFGA